MKLFDKKKDLILKITNLVLLIWLISAITFFQVALVDIIMPEQELSYKEYEILYCNYEEELKDLNNNCLIRYESEKEFQTRKDINRKKSLFLSLGNIIIVSIGIYLLNKDKK